MAEDASRSIVYRTPCRLSDLLKLQFWCAIYQLRYVWLFLLGIILGIDLIPPLFNGFTVLDVVAKAIVEPGDWLLPVAFGIAGGFVIAPFLVLLQWVRGKSTKEIRADIGREKIKVIGSTVNYETSWTSLVWMKEGRDTFLLKFKGMLLRLPKRGFTVEQLAEFREILKDRGSKAD